MLWGMNVLLVLYFLLAQAALAVNTSLPFHWEWQNSQELVASQSLRKAKMSDSDKDVIAKAIEDLISEEDSQMKPGRHLTEAALDTRVKMIDLNKDGTLEVVAQAMADCSPTGNCSFWVFQKIHDGYKLLLQGFGQTFTIQKETTNGYRDIVVSMHDSAFDSVITVYHYNHGAYEDVACYDAAFSIMQADGNMRELKEPQITPCGK